jgi:hypothetical protein
MLHKKTAMEVLGFDPKSDEYEFFAVMMTPEMAKWILDYHNNDNRNFYKSQLAALDKSIADHGWQRDGGVAVFNTDGNLIEAQHRLDRIIVNKLTVPFGVCLGAEKESFTKTAPAKQRHPVDEMYRKDKSATKEDETCLRQILARRGGTEKLTLPNAIAMWKQWKKIVREGREITKGIIKNTESFKSWNKELLGFNSLMVSIGKKEVAVNLMNLLENQVHGKETTLSKGFDNFKKGDIFTADTTNTEKSNIRFLMLSHAADQLEKRPNGMIEWDLSSAKCNHEVMKKYGNYRKFLVDPDNIGRKGAGFKSAA